jgi:hypothetical protein
MIPRESFRNQRTWTLRTSALRPFQVVVGLEARTTEDRPHEAADLIGKLPDIQIGAKPEPGKMLKFLKAPDRVETPEPRNL